MLKIFALTILVLQCLQSRALAQWVESDPCATKPFVAGVDVSGHQPWTEWLKVKEAQHHFAFVKATEGLTVINPNLYRDFKGLNDAGMVFGSYHYFIASDDPIKQAQYYLAMSGAPTGKELPPMFDWETNFKVAPNLVIRRAKQWLVLVEKLTGRIPIIYTYPKYWKSLFAGPNAKEAPFFQRYPLFVADYRGGCPEIPAPWKQWAFWQRGIKMASGINGRVDDDVFNGGLEDFTTFLALSVSH